MTTTIALVEDDKDISDLLHLYLTNEGYEIISFNDGQKALEYLACHTVDIAILDVMLPNVSGFELVKEIRKHFFYPIILLTARVEDIDKITGLSLGADDYITKPFNPLEVVARVKTQLRRVSRYNQTPQAEIIEDDFEIDIRGLNINKRSRTVTLYDKNLELTPIEFAILWHLASNKGSVVGSEELFECVWSEKYLDNNNTVMAHIARLREKMGEQSRNPKFVKTVWGVGYKIDE